MLKYLSHFAYYFGPLRTFDSIIFRYVIAVALSFIIALILGPRFINYMFKRKALEDVNKPDANKLQELHVVKKGTPTMGGLFMIVSVLISVFLCCDIFNPLVGIGIFVLVGFGALGFLDDYIKLKGWGKQGLNKRQKFSIEILLSIMTVAILAYGSYQPDGWFRISALPVDDQEVSIEQSVTSAENIAPTRLVIPFSKWSSVHPDLGYGYWILAAIMLVACSNAVNLTDGLDGLAAGCSVLVTLTYGILAYIAGNTAMCIFFRIPYIAGSGELAVFSSALVGGILGFLWFNANPAKVFMGDTGSLALGAIVAYMAIVTKQELVLIVAGGVFVFEALSVILQVGSFKLRGKRIFKIAPFHHHLEYSGWRENHVVVRTWIISALLSAMALGLLKMH